jgi:hypothetical protein
VEVTVIRTRHKATDPKAVKKKVADRYSDARQVVGPKVEAAKAAAAPKVDAAWQKMAPTVGHMVESALDAAHRQAAQAEKATGKMSKRASKRAKKADRTAAKAARGRRRWPWLVAGVGAVAGAAAAARRRTKPADSWEDMPMDGPATHSDEGLDGVVPHARDAQEEKRATKSHR